MELKIHKTLLEDLLSKVYPIVLEHSPFPGFSDILIEAKENKVYASAVSLDISATSTGEAEIISDGGIALNGKNLYNIIKELPSSILSLKVNNLLATIQCEKGKFEMAGMERSEFPSLLEIKGEKKISIPYSVLHRGIEKTLFASPTTERDNAPPVGMLLDLHQDEFRLVATDGNKLALFKRKLNIDKISRLLISPKVWREVAKFSSGVGIVFEEKKIGFYGENISLVSRLIEKSFPEYESAIFLDEHDKVSIVSKSELIEALRRTLIFAPDINKFIKFTFNSNSIMLETTSERGEAKEEVACKYDAPKFEIGYNGSFLLSIIERIDSSEVKIFLKAPKAATFILPTEQREEEEIMYLLMPIELE